MGGDAVVASFDDYDVGAVSSLEPTFDFGPPPPAPSPQGGGESPFHRRATQAGYTLLEVLLALMIVGVGSALVVTTIPPPEPTLAREARTLAARLTLASEEAVITGSPVGVDLGTKGYAFRRRIAGDWAPVTGEPALRPRAWPEGVAVEITREGVLLPPAVESSFGVTRTTADGRPILPAPTVRFDPVGAATLVAIDLRDDSGAWRVAVDAAGAVTIAEHGG